MKFRLLIAFLLTALTSFGLSVEVLNKADVPNLSPGQKFTFVEPATDTLQLVYVATLKGKDMIRKSNIESLYFAIREKANQLGANCYRISEFYTDQANGDVVLILEACYAPENLIDLNRSNHQKNVVYVFGQEKPDKKAMTFNLNGEERNIPGGTFYKIELKENEVLKLSKGGVTGAQVKIHYEKDKLPLFYSLSGFGLSSLERQPINGVSFSTGAINRIGNISLGLLMVALLEQAP